MTSKQRLLAALKRRLPDRMPVTTHHIMPYFLDKYMGGMAYPEFFNYFDLDPIFWVTAHRPDAAYGNYYDPFQEELGFLEPHRIVSDDWQISIQDISQKGQKCSRYNFKTPEKTLSLVLQRDGYTVWLRERLVKEKSDIDIIRKYAPVPMCDIAEVNRQADGFGDKGLIRGSIPGFDVYGQPGCWQDAAILFGIEELILETFYDPGWVHAFLQVLRDRKKRYIHSLPGAGFDLIELGGGDASTTVISPQIFTNFVAPYDAELIALAHDVGQKVVYHTCGGMMALLEGIADMQADAAETFTPLSLGGDTDLKRAKKRIGHRLCMIGGFDQARFFQNCTREETRREVRRCFDEAGGGGGYILAPSDHFFDADIELIKAYAEEAHKCIYA